MFEKTKKFVKEHKTEIIAGSVFIVGGVLIGYKINKMNNEMKLLKNTNNTMDNVIDKVNLEKVLDDIQKKIQFKGCDITDNTMRLDDLYDIGYNSLKREKDRIVFQIAELENYITNLDQTKNINIFHRIPEKEKMIQELKEQLTDIDFDMNRMKDIMGIIWGERD